MINKVMCVIGGAVVVSLGLFIGYAAQAQQGRPCAPRALAVERLAEKYQEHPQVMGLSARNGVMEVFASSETGTWTITVTMPNGTTCLVASGQAFEFVNSESPKPGEDL